MLPRWVRVCGVCGWGPSREQTRAAVFLPVDRPLPFSLLARNRGNGAVPLILSVFQNSEFDHVFTEGLVLEVRFPDQQPQQQLGAC